MRRLIYFWLSSIAIIAALHEIGTLTRGAAAAAIAGATAIYFAVGLIRELAKGRDRRPN